jgi:hypothetical protein
MTDRLILLRPNQRRICRGISYDSAKSRYDLDMQEGETLKVRVDASGILGTGESVSSIAVTADGLSISSALASNIATLTLSALNGYGQGDVKLTLTLSTSEVLIHRIRARSVLSARYDDYYTGVPT